MNILLTGPSGNLGKALLRLAPKHQWKSLDRENWTDLYRLSEDVQVVIHAASDLLTPFWKNPQAVTDSNLMSTVRLLEAIPKKARFVFISSCAVYGRSEVTKEDSELVPLSMNGIGKLLNEVMVKEYCTQHKVDFQILRLFNTFGGTDRFSILSHLQRSVQNKIPFTLFNQGVSQRDFIHVDDVASLVLELIAKPVSYEVMNLGSGEATRIRDIVNVFQAKHPALEVVAKSRSEAEYSRADIARLQEIVPHYEFCNVLNFIREEL